MEKQKYLNRASRWVLLAYVLVYACLIYVFLVQRERVDFQYVVLGEIAVLSNVLLGILLALIPSAPGYQIATSLAMLFIYFIYQIIASRYTAVAQLSELVRTPALILALPLLLPLAAGIGRVIKHRAAAKAGAGIKQ